MRWMDEWLSDRERGGFYASQDADIDLDDDGDHFTWTRDEARAVLMTTNSKSPAFTTTSEKSARCTTTTQRTCSGCGSAEEIAIPHRPFAQQIEALIDSAKKKMYAARLRRPIPYIDKTVYVSWNALCISAYLQAARVLGSQRQTAMP